MNLREKLQDKKVRIGLGVGGVIVVVVLAGGLLSSSKSQGTKLPIASPAPTSEQVNAVIPTTIRSVSPAVNPYEGPNPNPVARPSGWESVDNDAYLISYPPGWDLNREAKTTPPYMQTLFIRPQGQDKSLMAPLFTVVATAADYVPSLTEREKLYEKLGFTQSKITVNPSNPLNAVQWSGTIPAAQNATGKVLQETHIDLIVGQYAYQIKYSYEGGNKNQQMEQLFEKIISTIFFE